MKCPPHFYRFEEPAGATSIGVCKHCGKQAVGQNSIFQKSWRNWEGTFMARKRAKVDQPFRIKGGNR